MSQHQKIPVVGIGASAGGLESLERLFDRLQAPLDVAFVVVQHLSPHYESMMVQLLQRHTTMRVRLVTEPMTVEANTVYLIERNTELILDGDELRPAPRPNDAALNVPIDRFFESLATSGGSAATAIVLSGTGSDGTRGIAAVKAEGGLVIAESEATAKFSGMPGSARRSGCVDLILAPEQIGAALRSHYLDDPDGQWPQGAPGETLEAIVDLLGDTSGVDFGSYKEATISRRVARRMALLELADHGQYLDVLRRDVGERRALAQDLLIGVTRFFRDRHCFEHFDTQVLPELVETLAPGDEIRAWVAGCATGEEAYSLAILLHEAESRRAGSGRAARPIKLFATDVHQASIDVASAGVYPEERLLEVAKERVERFFEPHKNGFKVREELRRSIVFSKHDVVADPPFTGLHLASCRNLLIYLKPEAQRRVLGLLHFALEDGGVLFLGPSETTMNISAGFEPLSERFRIYRRQPMAKSRVVELGPIDRTRLVETRREANTGRRSTSDRSWLAVYDNLLDRFMPPAILLDDEQRVLDCYGGVERFLHLQPRRPSGTITSYLGTPARASVLAALHRAQRQSTSVQVPRIELTDETGRTVAAALRVEPIDTGSLGSSRHLLLHFELEPGPPASAGAAAQRDGEADATHDPGRDRSRIELLERDLEATKENLQATIEQLEVSNEELQATNEELTAANEEMQSTNEELNSVNEELHTVNTEYQKKNEELSELNRDMLNLLEASEIGTVFLDGELRIRRFSPDMGRLFRLQASDLGRRITDFAHTLTIDTLPERLSEVLRTGEGRELETRDDEGRARLLRLTPTRRADKVEGMVLTLIDIEALDSAHRLVEKKERRLQNWIDALPILVSHVDQEERYQAVNRAYAEAWQRPAEEIVGLTIEELLGSEAYANARPHVRQALAGHTVSYELTLTKPGGQPRVNLVSYEPEIDPSGEVLGFYGAVTDVTRLRHINQQLLEARVQAESADRAKSTFLANMSHEIRTPLAAILGHLELLQTRITDGEARRSLDIVARNGEHLLSLINDILHLSALDLGDRQPEMSGVRLRALVGEVTSILENRALAKGLRMETDYRPDLPEWIETDPRRVKQILTNLVGNAIKFTDEGLVTVTVGWESGDEEMVISVRDTGIGISPEDLERLFVPFEQLDGSSSRSYEGTGLGLSISAKLARQLGGELSAQSEVGVGSRFTVRLPARRVDDGAGEAPPSPRTSAAPRLSGRILVVDDQPDAREVTQRFLEQAGAEVLTAGGGAEALELFTAAAAGDQFDLVFLDVNMPQIDGLEVARRLRERGFTTPLVALTAGALEQDRQRALRAGCDDHASKPIDRRSLVACAARWLQRAGKQRQLTALIVEDEEDARLAVCELLRSNGVEASGAASAREALEQARSHVFDVVFCDINLPDGSGTRLVRELRRLRHTRETRIVALSGFSSTDRRDEALLFDGWIQKPASLAALLAAVDDEEAAVS
ncbi:MAG: response regulator [Acidobacteria bacterium]|nr:MAG: response regulator [Acidobacteriota bacterium]REK07815.1 MAG: response regulator [Acidobacteriota bacterium]